MKNDTFGLSIINGAKSFPAEAGRYSVSYRCSDGGADTTGQMDSFEAACREARSLLDERADHVLVFDRVRGYAVASGRN